MTNALLGLPAHERKRLIAGLKSNMLSTPYSVSEVQFALGIDEGAEAIVEALDDLSRLGISGASAAAWLESLEQALTQIAKPDFVWSGPEVAGLHARDTKRVYDELLGSAEQSLWVSTFAYFDGPKVFKVLAERMDSLPELKVTLLLNIQRGKGDTTSAEALVYKFADRFWTKDWPGQRRPQVYYEPKSLLLDSPSSVLHAKAVVSDEQVVFITSANLTEKAQNTNIETGILLRDRTMAASVPPQAISTSSGWAPTAITSRGSGSSGF